MKHQIASFEKTVQNQNLFHEEIERRLNHHQAKIILNFIRRKLFILTNINRYTYKYYTYCYYDYYY
jgi:hypothetical protein